MIPSKIAGFIFCVLLFFSFNAWAAEEIEKKQDEKKIFTIIEFESTFMNRKKEKLLEVLGEPDRKWEHSGKKIWTYHKIIKDQEKFWDQNILFDFNRINRMWATPAGASSTPSGHEDK
ncbi:MAG TPA: hypothetical protein EYP95_05080 [Nitrospinaceae bacterium]|nr:hypothetical protein [Nitrospinaceae bacterium]